jgi:glutaminyl-tRNA synthetase
VEDLPFGGRALGELVALVDGGTVTGPGAKQVLEELVEKGGEPAEIVRRRGLEQLDDAALEPVVAQILEAHPDNVELYRGGKTALLGFFVGQVMKATRGRANPQAVQTLLRRSLDEE